MIEGRGFESEKKNLCDDNGCSMFDGEQSGIAGK